MLATIIFHGGPVRGVRGLRLELVGGSVVPLIAWRSRCSQHSGANLGRICKNGSSSAGGVSQARWLAVVKSAAAIVAL